MEAQQNSQMQLKPDSLYRNSLLITRFNHQ